MLRFERMSIPVGGDESVTVLVANEDGMPRAVFMSYESFLELAAVLYTAIETMKAAGVHPDLVCSEAPSMRPHA